MEKEYNRNHRSYRNHEGENRKEYYSRQEPRRERPPYGERRERTEERNARNTNRAYKPRFGREEERPARRFAPRNEGNASEERRPRFPKRERFGGENGSSFRRREDAPERKERNYRREDGFRRERRPISDEAKEGLRQKHYSKKKLLSHRQKNITEETEMRLNRYISMGGVCSRRDADELIVAGRVKVNGEVVQTVGVKVQRKDRVEVDGVVVVPEKKIYLVLNKPKDYVTTMDDPLERKTVMSLVEEACKERIYPVGRLDRQTTGVLLFTNDGDLAKKLTHPKHDHKKIYHVFFDRPLSEADFQAIAEGVELEDGFIKPDEMEFTSPDNMEVGIEIHSGKNRIVRRIFEHFGYQITRLDRVYFAGITKKNLPRGRWRFLTSREVNMLKVY